MKKGIIRKAVSGVYYVEVGTEFLPCTAKGVFRNKGISPLVGDWVMVEEGNVVAEVLPRKNEFLRPRIANVDLAFLVVSTVKPTPNEQVLDKLIAICEYKGIEPVLVITKTDLGEAEELAALYQAAGFSVLFSGEDRDTGEALLQLMAGKVCVFIGNSGVGKSTLLNRLFPDWQLATGEVSDKLGRGRHTTRHVELYSLPGGGMIADTPGFGAVETMQYERIRKEELAECFREFREFSEDCKFQDCSHRVEKGCGVLAAVKEGKIAESRHRSYCNLYDEAQKIKDWE